MTHQTTASVVVCAYTERRWDQLVAAVTAAGAQLDDADQLLLVIDHNDQLLERARAELDGLSVLANTRTRGLSGARNTALDKVSGDLVVFLDDDAVPRPGWLAALRAPYADPDVQGVGGWATPAWPGGTRPDHLPPELDWVVGCSYRGMPTTRSEIRNLMGCNMSFRREVFDLIGGFDEGIGRVGTTPLGCEETELCIRLRQARPDARIVLEPAAVVDHSVSVDRVTWRYLRRRSYAEGLSKALISDDVGRDALTTELAYGRSVLPAAVARDAGSWLHGDRDAWRAAAAIPLSLASFGVGFVAGHLRRPHPVDDGFSPIHVGEIDVADLGADLDVTPAPDAVGADAVDYRHARLVVRDGRRVLGSVDVAVHDDLVRADDLRTAVRALPTVLRPDPVAGADLDAPDGARVAVVIATAGRATQVRRCVASILLGDRVPDEIVLVDNAPHLPDAAALQQLAGEHDRVRYVAEPVPGASRARNRGVAATGCDLVAFTDDDVVVDRWWLANLVAELRDPGVGLVTGLVMPQALDTAAQASFEGLGGFGKGFDRRVFERDDPTIHPLFPYTPGMVGSGNNMACRRTTWIELGGMSTLLGPGTPTRSGEDLDLFLRHLLAGQPIVYTPHALIWHEHRRREDDLVDQVRGYGTGLSALMTKLVTDQPRELAPVARRVGPGMRRLVGSSRHREVSSAAAPPRALRRAELAGFARGPVTLRRSRRAAARKDSS